MVSERTNACTSSVVIRPPGPVPETRCRSTPNSRAKRRVAGPAGTGVASCPLSSTLRHAPAMTVRRGRLAVGRPSDAAGSEVAALDGAGASCCFAGRGLFGAGFGRGRRSCSRRGCRGLFLPGLLRRRGLSPCRGSGAFPRQSPVGADSSIVSRGSPIFTVWPGLTRIFSIAARLRRGNLRDGLFGLDLEHDLARPGSRPLRGRAPRQCRRLRRLRRSAAV